MSKEEVESKSSQCKAVFLDTDNKPVHPSIHPLSVTALSLLWGHGVLFCFFAGAKPSWRGHARCQLYIRSNLGFSIVLKDTSTCSSAQPGAGI